MQLWRNQWHLNRKHTTFVILALNMIHIISIEYLFQQNHPHSNRNDPYHLLTRHEQVSIFRLRTGHNRLRNHLFHKLKTGDTDQCRCRTGSQTTEHLLHFCPNHEKLRKQIWPDPAPMSQKLYGSLEDLQPTTFVVKSGETIWQSRKKKISIGWTDRNNATLQTLMPDKNQIICNLFNFDLYFIVCTAIFLPLWVRQCSLLSSAEFTGTSVCQVPCVLFSCA